MMYCVHVHKKVHENDFYLALYMKQIKRKYYQTKIKYYKLKIEFYQTKNRERDESAHLHMHSSTKHLIILKLV